MLHSVATPFFAFSDARLRLSYDALMTPVRAAHPHSQLAWSYKTNYLGPVCRTLHELGAYAELMSEFELDLMEQRETKRPRIFLNAIVKSPDLLDRVIRQDGHVHCVCLDDLVQVEAAAVRLLNRASVALRISLPDLAENAWERFGFDPSGVALEKALTFIESSPWLELDGVHTHLGTFLQDPHLFSRAAAELSAFAERVESRFHRPLKYVDVGGGVASANVPRYKERLPRRPPALGDFGQAIAAGIRRLRPDLEVVLEVARAVIDPAGSLWTSVRRVDLQDDGQTLWVDTGIHQLYTAMSFWHPVCLPAADGPKAPLLRTRILGSLPMSSDVLGEDILLPPLAVGTRLRFENVGAYNLSMGMAFTSGRPAVLWEGRPGEWVVARREEHAEDVTQAEICEPLDLAYPTRKSTEETSYVS